MKAFALPIVCVAALLPNATSGLKCYSCSSTIMMGCNATTIPATIEPPAQECNPVPSVKTASSGILPTCSRISGRIKLPSGGSAPAVVRECVGYVDPVPLGCRFLAQPGWDGEVEYCVCNYENCNGHGSISSGIRIEFTHFSVFLVIIGSTIYL